MCVCVCVCNVCMRIAVWIVRAHECIKVPLVNSLVIYICIPGVCASMC